MISHIQMLLVKWFVKYRIIIYMLGYRKFNNQLSDS